MAGSVYLPFGAGPRACIGNQLALHQMTLVGLLAARRFTSTPILEVFAPGPDA